MNITLLGDLASSVRDLDGVLSIYVSGRPVAAKRQAAQVYFDLMQKNISNPYATVTGIQNAKKLQAVAAQILANLKNAVETTSLPFVGNPYAEAGSITEDPALSYSLSEGDSIVSVEPRVNYKDSTTHLVTSKDWASGSASATPSLLKTAALAVAAYMVLK